MGVANKRRESLATRKSKGILGTHVPKSKPKPKRKKPKHLAKKLSEIRAGLGLSQGGMLRRLGLESELERDYISKYERGVLEPPLHVLLAYARAVSLSTDILIDDKLDLPASLPSKPKDRR
jgi:DNA-binding XRE family transcriptional regulator